VNGKISIYEKFRACLLSELSEEMRDVVDDYVRMRPKVNPPPPRRDEKPENNVATATGVSPMSSSNNT
jgi:hypothetical protein